MTEPTNAHSPTVRVGAVNYLNSKPLIEGLDQPGLPIELVLDYPSRLADDLKAGRLDVGLIPSIEFLRNPGYSAVSDACVACRGPVLSVKLYSRVPMGDVRRLALDEGSRTSAVLAQVMLLERFGSVPDTEPLPMGSSTDATDADAVLLIGDRAIRPPAEPFVEVWDLGEEWTEWTGLPFVFALWAGSRDAVAPQVAAMLAQARDRGVSRLPAIARRESGTLGISEQTAYDYLSRNLHFHFGSAEQNGLELFEKLLINDVECQPPPANTTAAGTLSVPSTDCEVE